MNPTYDVFLSYNSRDHQAVEKVGRWLKENGLTCFIDRWYLIAGRPWQSALQEALKQSAACVVFLGPGGMGGWQQRELDLALDRQVGTGMPVVPVLLPGADPALSFLSLNTWIDLRSDPNEERRLRVLAGAIRGLAPTEIDGDVQPARATICPFRGLLPFREEDAPLFFGRGRDTERLVEAVARHPFVAVLGGSGSGKSSVVRAGLVPVLRKDEKTAWEVVTLVPTARPLNSLVNALSTLLWPDLDDEIDRREKANEKTSSFEKGTLSLRDLVEIALAKQPGTQRLLIFIDQWEELYTLCRDDKSIRIFTDQLLEASRSAPLTVIFTCRADFYGPVLGYRPLVERIVYGAQVSLGPMDEAELKQVIEAPAKKVGLEFEAGLAARILGDVGQGSGRLPLLSFLLEQLWKQRRGPALTNEAFDATGGVEGAIATVADGVFDRLTEVDKARLPRLFIQMVSVGEESAITRRRAAMTTLGEQARPVVEKMVEARLLVTDSDKVTETVEVAHEALIIQWERSQGWVNSARGFLTWRKRLEPFLKLWQGDRRALLRGGLLVEAQRWLEERSQDLDVPECEFIEESVRQQEQEREHERRRARVLAGLSVAALIAACLACGGAAIAWNRWGVAADNEVKAKTNGILAEANEKIAKANAAKAIRNLSASLAAQSAAVQAESPQRSVLLTLEAIKTCEKNGFDPIVAAVRSLLASTCEMGGVGISVDRAGISAEAIDGHGRWLVIASDDKTARLWDLNVDRPEDSARVLKGYDARDNPTTIFGDGRWLVYVSWNDHTAKLWNLNAERPEDSARILKGHDDVIVAVKISYDGRRLVTSSRDGTARLWFLNAERPEMFKSMSNGHETAFYSVSRSSDGKWIASDFWDNTARSWEFNLDDLRKIAARAVGRNFTRKEWEEIFPGEDYRKTFERLSYPPNFQTPPR